MTTTFLALVTAGWVVVPFPEMGENRRGESGIGLGEGRSQLGGPVNAEVSVLHPSVQGGVWQLDIRAWHSEDRPKLEIRIWDTHP